MSEPSSALRGAGHRLRRGMAVLAAAAVVPVLAGCDTNPGAAAVVGDNRISTTTLQHQVDAALANPAALSALGGNRLAATRQLLSYLISVDLVNATAAAHHLTLTPQDVSTEQASFVQQAGSLSALQQQAAAGGIPSSSLNQFIRYRALQQKIGQALVATLPATQAQLRAQYQKDIDQYDRLDISQIQVTSGSLAHRILRQARSRPSTFATLARRYSTDTASKANGGHVGLVGRSQVITALGSAAATAKPGTVLLSHRSKQFIVVRINQRKVTPLSAVTSQVKTALFSGQADSLFQKALTDESARVGVHISPRYGRWDPKTQTVVAAPNPVSSPG